MTLTSQIPSPTEPCPSKERVGPASWGPGNPGSRAELRAGLRPLCLRIPQSNEPVSLPPAGQQSPVRGGVKRPVCGFPCKQDLELQRRLGLG